MQKLLSCIVGGLRQALEIKNRLLIEGVAFIYLIKFVLFQSKEDGELGITVSAFMFVPMTDDEKDEEAARRALAFNVAW